MRVLRNIVAFLLLAAWPVITSHPLLEKWGLIHEINEHGHPHAGESDHAHEHSTADHAFAHGSYLSGSRLFQGSKALVCLFFFLVAALALSPLRFRPPQAATPSGPSPPGAAPPRAWSTWQFTLRAASQPRAPSFFS